MHIYVTIHDSQLLLAFSKLCSWESDL